MYERGTPTPASTETFPKGGEKSTRFGVLGLEFSKWSRILGLRISGLGFSVERLELRVRGSELKQALC